MSIKAFTVDNYDQQLILLKDLVSQIATTATESSYIPTIGVIAKKHNSLESVASLLNSYNIPIKYEKSDNILEYTHIKWIVQIMRFCLKYKDVDSYNSLDPLVQDIASFPFWGVNSIALFDLATQVNSAKKLNKEASYLSSMLIYQSSPLSFQIIGKELSIIQETLIQDISKWLINLAITSPNLSLGQILDIILGVGEALGVQTEELE